MRIGGWTRGNRVALLENGEAFFPRVFAAMAQARTEIIVETFIVFEDVIGNELQQVLIAAARRGVVVDLTLDGYGCADLTPAFLGALTEAGVRVHLFDPHDKLFGMRTNVFRRMHRKIVVVDGEVAFVGGLNYSHDHVREFGPEAKQDYAVELEGPVVRDIHRLAAHAVAELGRTNGQHAARREPVLEPEPTRHPGPAEAILVARDNRGHRSDIERHYRDAIRAARSEIIIANAYFFPGYGVLRELRNAARRGVNVRLVLQGNPDKPIMKRAGESLYEFLLDAGAQIHEYCERPLHGKVATIDDEWATVGSSNLDPLSLFLNLEANVVIRDRAFNRTLRNSLLRLMRRHCREIGIADVPQRTLGQQLLTFTSFHVLRRFPSWAGWEPGHKAEETLEEQARLRRAGARRRRVA